MTTRTITKIFFGNIKACALLLLLPMSAHATCDQMWEVGALLANERGGEVVLHTGHRARQTISTQWLHGLEIVHQKIDAVSGISTKLFLCAAPEPNAFAWYKSGGNVALTTGMHHLIKNDWHVYAALLGHENAHLVKKHGKQRQKREIGLHLGKAALESVLDGKGGIASDVLHIGFSAVGASYSRDEEREADKVGVIYAHCAGFSPDGALRLHRKLDSAGNFLSSHPSSRQRIRKLRTTIEKQQRAPRCD